MKCINVSGQTKKRSCGISMASIYAKRVTELVKVKFYRDIQILVSEAPQSLGTSAND